MASAMLEIIQEVTDDYGSAFDLATRIESGHVPDNLLDGLPTRWAERRSTIEPPEYEDGYHPYIPDPLRSRAIAMPGTHFLFDFINQDETNKDLLALKKHLLYANSLALSDPIPQIFDERYFDSGEPHDDVLSYRRTRLANLVRFLDQVDLLLEDDILVFIDAPRYRIDYKKVDLLNLALRTEIRDAVDKLDPAAKEFAAQAGERMMGVAPGTMPFGPESYAMHALNGVLAGLATCTNEYGGWDLYLPQAAMQSVLAYVVRRANETPKSRQGSDRHDPKLLPALFGVELPDIAAKVTIPDLVKIRRSDDAFDEWRRELSGALRALNEELAENKDLPADQMRAILREQLKPAADHAAGEVGRSKALCELRGEGVSLLFGGVVEALFHGEVATAAAVTLAATACASLVYKWLNGRKTASANRALVRHYAVFSD